MLVTILAEAVRIIAAVTVVGGTLSDLAAPTQHPSWEDSARNSPSQSSVRRAPAAVQVGTASLYTGGGLPAMCGYAFNVAVKP